MFNLPEGHQPVFIYFSGEGGQEYFTASSKEEAAELILKEKGITQWNSAFITHVIVRATRPYFFRDGIPMHISDATKVEFKPVKA
jgi:hypothetical protein